MKRMKSIFVPAWGWVGSKDKNALGPYAYIFSSPLGDGLVLTNNGYINRNIIFSSPSGDGLVRRYLKNKVRISPVFVPEWGWVGSLQFSKLFLICCCFRPRVGMGWFLKETARQAIKIVFVPEWGWVGSADFNRNFKKLSNTI